VKKEEITEGTKPGKASKTKPPLPLLAQGLDLPLASSHLIRVLNFIKLYHNVH